MLPLRPVRPPRPGTLAALFAALLPRGRPPRLIPALLPRGRPPRLTVLPLVGVSTFCAISVAGGVSGTTNASDLTRPPRLALVPLPLGLPPRLLPLPLVEPSGVCKVPVAVVVGVSSTPSSLTLALLPPRPLLPPVFTPPLVTLVTLGTEAVAASRSWLVTIWFKTDCRAASHSGVFWSICLTSAVLVLIMGGGTGRVGVDVAEAGVGAVTGTGTGTDMGFRLGAELAAGVDFAAIAVAVVEKTLESVVGFVSGAGVGSGVMAGVEVVLKAEVRA